MKPLTLLCLAEFLALASCTESKGAPPSPAQRPPLVYVAPIVRRDLALYSDSVATLDGFDNAEVRARVRGYVKSLNFKDGAQVKAGDVLFMLEEAEWTAGVASANAALTRARVMRDHHRIQLDRDHGLLASGMVSQQEVDNTSAALADADGQIEAAKAALTTAALNLSYTQVRTPIDGLAGLAMVRVGNLVGQDGPTLLTTVSQTDVMRINFALSEVDYVRHPERFKNMDVRTLSWAREQFAELDEGKRADGDDPGVDLVLADGSVYGHKAIVVSVDRKIDPSTGTLQVQALVPNPDGLLRPGQYARARIRQSDAGHDELVVPQRALVSIQGVYSVAVVGDDGKAHLRKVELGPMSNGVQIVTHGVVEGDRIVVEGVQKVADGAPVNAQPQPEPRKVGSAR